MVPATRPLRWGSQAGRPGVHPRPKSLLCHRLAHNERNRAALAGFVGGRSAVHRGGLSGADREHAERKAHLTARTAGEIARAAASSRRCRFISPRATSGENMNCVRSSPRLTPGMRQRVTDFMDRFSIAYRRTATSDADTSVPGEARFCFNAGVRGPPHHSPNQLRIRSYTRPGSSRPISSCPWPSTGAIAGKASLSRESGCSPSALGRGTSPSPIT